MVGGPKKNNTNEKGKGGGGLVNRGKDCCEGLGGRGGVEHFKWVKRNTKREKEV